MLALSSRASNPLVRVQEERRPLKTALLALAARTCRGEIATAVDKTKALQLIAQLEGYNPTPDPVLSELAEGVWELVFSSTQLFRSSPFFMAARAVCKEGQEADRFNMFCDLHREALAFTSIGKVRQIVTSTTLISEFETRVALVPGLPLVVLGTILSSADIERKESESMTLYMDKVRIKEGTSNIPFLKEALNEFTGLPIRALGGQLERSVSGYKNPRPVFSSRYVDAHMRICRDQDNNVFVYNRAS